MSKQSYSRRDVLKLSGTVIAGTVLASCGPKATQAPVEPPLQPAAEATTAPPAGEPVAAPPAKKPQGNVVVFHDLKEITEENIAQFEAGYPGITIEFIDREEPARLYAMIAAGTPPDLIRTQAPAIPGYLARGLMADLTPYFEASTVLKVDDLLPANDYYKAESPLQIGSGKIYGMVKDFSPDFTIFAFKKAFDDAGVPVPDPSKVMTYAEVLDLARKVGKVEGDRVLTWGYAYGDEWVDRIWMNCLAETGQSLYSEDYNRIIIADNPEARNLAQYYFNLAKENLAASPVNPSPSGWTGTDFTAGTVAMHQYGFWFSAMAEADPTRGQVVLLPGPTWAGVRRDPTMTATGMVMSKDAANPEAAWVVFEWFNGGEIALQRAAGGWGVPGLKSMLHLVPQETEFQKQVFQVLEGEMALETPPLQFNPFIGDREFPDSWLTHLEQALRGDVTFDDMIAGIEFDVNTAISEGIDRIVG
jgi:multiple sugar transport system substrate-binding protein